MDLIFDPRGVEKAGNLKWDENLRFRHWLRIQDPPTLEATVEMIGRKVSAMIDCTQCANCCKGLTVAPRSLDVKRLSDGLNLTPFQFKTKYLKKDQEGDLVFKQRPCPFLKNNRCSVYEQRPETCRSYPHLDQHHMTGRGWHIVENTRICPIVYNVYELLKQHFRYRPQTETQL